MSLPTYLVRYIENVTGAARRDTINIDTGNIY